ncbi:hypothetical protein E6H16_04190 [Candidatus Bathyarchaeota archaeon]|nr:MAG: hypothetical protein E6H16_04190 [Candidatus Bathyarchaeota archaeon]
MAVQFELAAILIPAYKPEPFPLFLGQRNPRAVSLHGTLKRLVKDPKAVHAFDAEQFGVVLLDRYKEVFDRLADM